MVGKAGKTLAILTIRGGNRLEINIFTYFWLDSNSCKSGHPDIYHIFIKYLKQYEGPFHPVSPSVLCVCVHM